MAVASHKFNGSLVVSGNVNGVTMQAGAVTCPGSITSTDGNLICNNLTLNGTSISAPYVTSFVAPNASFYTDTINTTGNITTIDPTSSYHAATMHWVLEQLAQIVTGYIPLEPVIAFYDPTPGLPASPTVGDRYVSTATANGWIVDDIYQWSGGIWSQNIPVQGNALTSKTGPNAPYSMIYTIQFGWALIGFNGMHDSLVGKEFTNAASSAPLTLTSGTYTNQVLFGWNTMNNRAWIMTIEAVGASTAGAGYAHCSWMVIVLNNAGTITFDITRQTVSTVGNLSGTTFSLSSGAPNSSNYLNVLVSYVGATSATWHVTVEGTYVPEP